MATTTPNISIRPAEAFVRSHMRDDAAAHARMLARRQQLPDVQEFVIDGFERGHLHFQLTQRAILSVLLEHHSDASLTSASVFAGIEGTSLLHQGTLFGDRNHEANEAALASLLYATTAPRWRQLVNRDEKGDNPFSYALRNWEAPAIVSFDTARLEAHSPEQSNTRWSVQPQYTVPDALQRVYYLAPEFLFRPRSS